MNEEQEAWVHQVYTHAAGKVLDSTPKLFTDDPDKPGRLAAHGSAVLLKVENDHYLLTAAHCIFQHGKTNPIKVLDSSGHPRTIRGAVAKSKGTPDNIDVAAVKLSDQSTEILTKTCVFLDGTCQIMLNDNIRHETDYLSVGYPNTTTDIDNRRKKIRYNPLVYISKSVNAEAYLKLDVNPSQSILLGYNQRKSTFVEPKELNWVRTRQAPVEEAFGTFLGMTWLPWKTSSISCAVYWSSITAPVTSSRRPKQKKSFH